MTTLTVKFESKLIDYISDKKININNYLEKLIKEDILLSEIKDSKKSWIVKMNSLDDLDS